MENEPFINDFPIKSCIHRVIFHCDVWLPEGTSMGTVSLVGWFLRHFLFFHILEISSSQLTNIFQMGWNHQPVIYALLFWGLSLGVNIGISLGSWLGCSRTVWKIAKCLSDGKWLSFIELFNHLWNGIRTGTRSGKSFTGDVDGVCTIINMWYARGR